MYLDKDLSPCSQFEKSNSENPMFSAFEPIVDLNRDMFAREILFRVNDFNNSHVIVLKELRARKETFMLFTRICQKAFNEAKVTGDIIHVNLEIQDLLNPSFLYFIDSILDSVWIKPSLINFELLETEKITSEVQKQVFTNLKILVKMWFLLSIDDLFSWYSTKRRVNNILLHGIDLHMVKIDGKFIQDAYIWSLYWYDSMLENVDINNIEWLSDYIEWLKSKDIKVLAEWIETENMLEFAKSLWAEYFQWYLFQNHTHKKLHII